MWVKSTAKGIQTFKQQMHWSIVDPSGLTGDMTLSTVYGWYTVQVKTVWRLHWITLQSSLSNYTPQSVYSMARCFYKKTTGGCTVAQWVKAPYHKPSDPGLSPTWGSFRNLRHLSLPVVSCQSLWSYVYKGVKPQKYSKKTCVYSYSLISFTKAIHTTSLHNISSALAETMVIDTDKIQLRPKALLPVGTAEPQACTRPPCPRGYGPHFYYSPSRRLKSNCILFVCLCVLSVCYSAWTVKAALRVKMGFM